MVSFIYNQAFANNYKCLIWIKFTLAFNMFCHYCLHKDCIGWVLLHLH